MTLPPDRFPRCLAAWSSYAWARFKTSCILFKSEAGKPAALCKRAECPRCGLPAILILTVSVVIPESAGPFRALGARVACASGAPRFHGRPASSVGGRLHPGPGFFEGPFFPFPALPIRPEPQIPEDPGQDLADRAVAEFVIALIVPQALGEPVAQIVALLEILGRTLDPLLGDPLDLGFLQCPAPGLGRRPAPRRFGPRCRPLGFGAFEKLPALFRELGFECHGEAHRPRDTGEECREIAVPL